VLVKPPDSCEVLPNGEVRGPDGAITTGAFRGRGSEMTYLDDHMKLKDEGGLNIDEYDNFSTSSGDYPRFGRTFSKSGTPASLGRANTARRGGMSQEAIRQTRLERFGDISDLNQIYSSGGFDDNAVNRTKLNLVEDMGLSVGAEDAVDTDDLALHAAILESSQMKRGRRESNGACGNAKKRRRTCGVELPEEEQLLLAMQISSADHQPTSDKRSCLQSPPGTEEDFDLALALSQIESVTKPEVSSPTCKVVTTAVAKTKKESKAVSPNQELDYALALSLQDVEEGVYGGARGGEEDGEVLPDEIAGLRGTETVAVSARAGYGAGDRVEGGLGRTPLRCDRREGPRRPSPGSMELVRNRSRRSSVLSLEGKPLLYRCDAVFEPISLWIRMSVCACR